MSYITTYTGLHFDPVNPQKERIEMKDIAHALSLTCRGNGHVKQFFSVGQHCILCAKEAAARGYSREIVLACLLHDASEAYMSDVPRPFKMSMQSYIAAEERLLDMIYEVFLGRTLKPEEKALVKHVDDDLLAYDLYYLLGEGSKEMLPEIKISIQYDEILFDVVEEEYLILYKELKDLP